MPEKGGTGHRGAAKPWDSGPTLARRAGSEVEVLDAEGKVRAMTGRVYHISIAPVLGEHRNLMESIAACPAAANCGYAWDFIDCTAARDNQYCRPE